VSYLTALCNPEVMKELSLEGSEKAHGSQATLILTRFFSPGLKHLEQRIPSQQVAEGARNGFFA
jgi:hypothetical protein